MTVYIPGDGCHGNVRAVLTERGLLLARQIDAEKAKSNGWCRPELLRMRAEQTLVFIDNHAWEEFVPEGAQGVYGPECYFSGTFKDMERLFTIQGVEDAHDVVIGGVPFYNDFPEDREARLREGYGPHLSLLEELLRSYPVRNCTDYVDLTYGRRF